MKILVAHNHYLHPGGEDQVVRDEVSMLRKYGHEVIEYDCWNREIDNLGFIRKIWFFLKDSLWLKKTYNDICLIIEREKPQIAHVHNIFFAISPSIYDACFDKGVPVVQTLHNYRFLCLSGIFYRAGRICSECVKKSFMYGIFYKCCHSSRFLSLICARILWAVKKNSVLSMKIKFFIAPSEFCKEKYVEAGVSKKKIFIKPHFVYNDPGVKESVRKYILFVGALREYKGVEVLIDAVRSCLGSYLRIVGDGPLKEEMKQYAHGMNNIEFLGHLSHDAVIEQFHQALFVVFPSNCYETFGCSIIEAFACGVPVIVSNAGAAMELVELGITGRVFKVNDSLDLAQNIRKLLADQLHTREMGNNARAVYEKRYTMNRNYEEMMNIYNAAQKVTC